MRSARSMLWLVVLGCVSAPPRLVPGPNADKMQGRDATAEALDQDARFEVDATAWPGDAEIARAVTPLEVSVENRGTEPLRVTYASFVLEGHRSTYAALPPFAIDATVPSDRLQSLHWTYRDYFVAPHHRPYFRSDSLYHGTFGPDVAYYRHYYPHWRGMESLPTPEMLSWALPEGVLQPGGRIQGYLYFERVDDDERDVRFRAHLRSAASGMEIANVTIPFMVIEGD